jgi:menaquinone-dependent protoporphyrinogen oxidase
MTKVLVAHASRFGSTAETAGRVADVLEASGLEVERRPASEVRSLDGYDALVLGSGIYAGRLHKDARRLLGRVGGLPLAVFAMGPGKPEEFDAARVQLEGALEHAGAAPLLAEVFGGVFDPARLRFPLNRLPSMDLRDWDAVEAWARDVAAVLEGRLAAV